MAWTPMLVLLRWLVAAACLAAHRADAHSPRGPNDDSTPGAIRANGFNVKPMRYTQSQRGGGSGGSRGYGGDGRNGGDGRYGGDGGYGGNVVYGGIDRYGGVGRYDGTVVYGGDVGYGGDGGYGGNVVYGGVHRYGGIHRYDGTVVYGGDGGYGGNGRSGRISVDGVQGGDGGDGGHGEDGGGGGGGGQGSLQWRIVTPVWAIALAALAALALLVAAALFVAAKCRDRSMNKKQVQRNEPSLSTSLPSESLGYRSSSVYDDCMPAVHMGHHPLLHHSPPSHHPEPLYERVKGLQSEKLQGLQALAAAAAAKVAGEAKPEPAASAPSSHYVAMGGHSQLIYDDAQGLVRSAPQPTYCNLPAEARDSNPYVEPGSPVYDVATGADARASHHSTGYNRPYSHFRPDPWRGW